MRIEYESPEQLKRGIRNILAKYIDLEKYQVFFFGSRVCGKGDDRSDIDIGISGAKPIPIVKWSNIQDEIEELPN